MAFSLAACSHSSTGTTKESANTTDIAFAADVGNIDDQSFNQYTWQGIQDFCTANGLKANYYRPTEDSTTARVEQMDNAVKDGARVIVMAGYLFGPALQEAQTKYPEIQFIALDISTNDLPDPGTNTALITYREEQAGYLAGYAAVEDGYKQLGFLGGIAVPSVIRYGYGFVQGADAAAKAMGANDVSVKYWYSGSFAASDEIKSKMDGWYAGGTQVVFSCGGSIYQSCLAAAQANDGKIIGVDVDQSAVDPCVITSAMKALATSITAVLTDCENNGGKLSAAYGGKETKLGAAENCVGLPMENSRFTNFTQAQYDTIFAALADGSVKVDDSFDAAVTPTVTDLKVDYEQ